MYIFLRNNDYRYAAEQMLLMLFPEERPVYPSADPGLREENAVELELKHGKTYTTAVCRLRYDRRTVQKHVRARTDGIRAGEERARIEQRILKLAFYRAALDVGVPKPEWGCLTGVRPAKFLAGLMQKDGLTETAAVRMLTETFGVSKERASLALAAERAAARAKAALAPQDVCLYIGIPFCPSICLYCSFGSHVLSRWEHMVDPYLDALIKELIFISENMKDYTLDTIYIGGGTPTTLNAAQMERLLAKVTELFPMEQVQEFTVEAGRPDTINEEVLKAIRKFPVTRISINPQTMNQETLDLIGRHHTVEEIEEKFRMARSLGFDNINMDLIVGLPGEDKEKVAHTLEKVEALNPDSLTIHYLALKRATRLNLFKDKYQEISFENSAEIMKMTMDSAHRMEMGPYYMYRQKNMAGNFENVGYSREGKAGIYNILIMEEKQSILAAGAGASTKFVFEHGERIERVENVKDLKNYVERIDEMIERKRIGMEKYLPK